MRIKKTTENTPRTSETVNVESNSTKNAYACDYINKRNTYSTDEVFTGKYWIDGKKIYRKVIDTTIGNILNALNNIPFDSIVFIDGRYESNYGYKWKINSNVSENDYRLTLYNSTSTGEFLISRGSFAGDNYNIQVVFEYTKTND